jgi:DNA topoisomerase VI subunit B
MTGISHPMTDHETTGQRTACATLERTTFRTSRLLDFASDKELVAQIGHAREAWPIVVLKELIDNAIDACEEAGIPPVVTVMVDACGIIVEDNGPGLPTDVIEDVLDFSVRVSSREAYVSPTRGAQGNALKTIVGMPFVLDGHRGRTVIEALGIRHTIELGVDRIRQQPTVDHRVEPGDVTTGTRVTVEWPDSGCSILAAAMSRFLQLAAAYTWLNPHLGLTVTTPDLGVMRARPTDPAWTKWRPSDPTSAHWYKPEHFERLIAGYIAHDADRGRVRTVRELVTEFRGLSGTAKQKAVLEETGLWRAPLSALANGTDLDHDAVARLLAAMKARSLPVKPAMLGCIGRDHLAARFAAYGCEMASFDYRRVMDTTDGVPWVVETAFGWCPDADSRRLVCGVNWSPGIVNPFRELGRFGESLDTILAQQRASRHEPVVLVLHMACPRVEYTDRGKSAVVVRS